MRRVTALAGLVTSLFLVATPEAMSQPAGKKKVDDSKAVKLIDRDKLRYKKDKPTAFPVLTVTQEYAIGVLGYESDNGFMVAGLMKVRDYSVNKTRSPGAEIKADVNGNGNYVNASLDPGDTIVTIDGIWTTTVEEVVSAIQYAANKSDIEIEILTRSGKTVMAKINAAKIRK